MTLETLAAALAAMSVWELIAVALGIAYLLLAVRESLWCWYAAFTGTAISLYLFWQVGLVMESALQVYYLAMAVYGWWQWQHADGAGDEAGQRPISRWTPGQHGVAIGAVLAASALSGALLARYTDAAMPYLDSFTTWGAILTTWMVARKVLENWLYWLVIDGASIYLYIDRELYLFSLLFAVYLVIVVAGFWQWLQHYRSATS
ncbi:nicotinamide riboside transporter PnuC [Parahaliea mediterranea]|uniref:Nicotinamide riboside transporter PnuC n=1 Tax=Parahaliea mediterranea TaxID=651086 RepID=A0A939DCB0_9GAMM|nr:nicotinamide riboside transporter PnuC [Parahaliea mediterranea]MBN7795414.1 nicotinamide mononucleotide transporter [Parahaliea mediterranea]